MKNQEAPPPPLLDMSVFNITKTEPILTEKEQKEANRQAEEAKKTNIELRTERKVANKFTDATCFRRFLQPPIMYGNGRMYYDVHAYNLTRTELGGFFVYPIANDKLPTVFEGETYNNDVLFNTVENAKIAQYHNEAYTNAVKYEYRDQPEKVVEDQITKYSNYTKKNKSAIHYEMLIDGLFTGSIIYDHAVNHDPTRRKFLADKNREKLMVVVYKYYSRLLQMNRSSPAMLNNLAHIIWYMQGKTYFEKENIAFKKSFKEMGGTLNRYCASLTLYDEPIPIYWVIFSIRKTEQPIQRASLLLHGWCQSLLGMAMMDASDKYAGKTFKGLGPFVLSFLINIAASIARMPIYALYMESLPGTDKTIKSMKITANPDENVELDNKPPYLTTTDYQTKAKNKKKILNQDADILYAGTGGGEAKQFLRDKLIMEETVVKFWERWIDPTVLIPKAPQMMRFDNGGGGGEKESSSKRLKQTEVCISCKITNPQFAPGGNRKLGLYCGEECYHE